MVQAGGVIYLFLKIPMAILENFFHSTKNIASQVIMFYKTEQGVGSSSNRNSCCIISSRLSILLLCSHRTNRTCLRDELYATGKLKEVIAFDDRRTHTNWVIPMGLCPAIFRCHKISWFRRHLGLARCVAHTASISCKIF